MCYMKGLLDKLIGPNSQYSRHLRPVRYENETVAVDLQMELYIIREMVRFIDHTRTRAHTRTHAHTHIHTHTHTHTHVWVCACMLETSCYAFGGRIRRFTKVNVNKVNMLYCIELILVANCSFRCTPSLY